MRNDTRLVHSCKSVGDGSDSEREADLPRRWSSKMSSLLLSAHCTNVPRINIGPMGVLVDGV